MKVLEKVERRLGEKLFLKGDRCIGPKCAFTRRGYPPGIHGKKRKRGLSEYGLLLQEKQKVRYLYGLDDKDMKRYTKEAVSQPGIFGSNLLRLLESRLDNVIFRGGFSESRRIARRLVSDGHVMINGKTVNIPSARVKKGNIISIKEKMIGRGPLVELESRIKKYESPAWLDLDKNKKEVKVLRDPEVNELEVQLDVTKIKEFYSR